MHATASFWKVRGLPRAFSGRRVRDEEKSIRRPEGSVSPGTQEFRDSSFPSNQRLTTFIPPSG
jgi:hypothetical protein